MAFGQHLRDVVIIVGSQERAVIVPVDDFTYVVEAVQVMNHARDRGVVSSIDLYEVCQVLTKPAQLISCHPKVAR